jgi:hypothetical protein
MKTFEHDARLDILNTLLTTPHRRLDLIWPVHEELVGKDPRFYVHLAAWYFDRGEVRDHKEAFIVALALSRFPGHRDVGLALLRQLPPYQVVRVVDFITGRKAQPVKQASPGGKKAAEAQPAVADVGLFRALPRSLRTEVTRYLREREANHDWFDSTALVARKALKRLYALLHVHPGDRAQKILFDREPPAGSRLAALRALARATSPAEQAQAIVEHAIPYRVASSIMREMTAEVLLALVQTMSPQELINSLAALKRRGALEDPAVAALVEQKLAAARTDNRVSAYKAEVAATAAGIEGELSDSLREVTATRLRACGTIRRSTALLLDRSGSMTVALEVGKRLGEMISSVCTAELYCYVFDTAAVQVRPEGRTLAAWESALAGIAPGGGTSIGIGLEALRRAGQRVEQLVLVTDEDENTAPLFQDAYEAYARELGVRPAVAIIRVGAAAYRIEEACKQRGIAVSVFRFEGDYYALPNVLPLLSQPSQMDLLMEILDHPLPVRLAS